MCSQTGQLHSSLPKKKKLVVVCCIGADGMHCVEVERLAGAIYAPYKPYIIKYASFEAEALSQALDSIRLVSSTRLQMRE